MIFRALASGKSLDEVRSSCLGGKLLRPGRTRDATPHLGGSALAVLRVDAARLGDRGSRRSVPRRRHVPRGSSGLVYLHFARRDRLTFDFVVDKLWPHWKGGARDVRRDDVIDFLAESANGQPTRWRESTRVKLAGNVLSALRDFGLLTGVQRKALQRPVVAPEVVLHLCRLLDAEGLRGRALLEARDWRLFLWDIQDTSQALAQLAQRGELRFERSGRTVVLDVPRHPLGEGR
jgi:hypothetical protein